MFKTIKMSTTNTHDISILRGKKSHWWEEQKSGEMKARWSKMSVGGGLRRKNHQISHHSPKSLKHTQVHKRNLTPTKRERTYSHNLVRVLMTIVKYVQRGRALAHLWKSLKI